jgi:hypothetical protein
VNKEAAVNVFFGAAYRGAEDVEKRAATIDRVAELMKKDYELLSERLDDWDAEALNRAMDFVRAPELSAAIFEGSVFSRELAMVLIETSLREVFGAQPVRILVVHEGQAMHPQLLAVIKTMSLWEGPTEFLVVPVPTPELLSWYVTEFLRKVPNL